MTQKKINMSRYLERLPRGLALERRPKREPKGVQEGQVAKKAAQMSRYLERFPHVLALAMMSK